ncbi:MAG: chorismate mutase, partial [Bacteroidales bacterium]|nr:chorismate mutase [Bacteroidales bacterium]
MEMFKDIIPINQWFDKIIDSPMIIAGPCSAETEEQVLKTATELYKTQKVDVFRAGIWKPRTRPGNFEGVGEKGLVWLDKVKKETNLLVAIEVANPKHVEIALKYNIDMFWIGARTASNPFSMQELANSLKGVDIPILVKNPINPDINLWIGAIERLYNVGIRKLAAVHRGFFPFEKTAMRNIPKWEIPIELKSKFHNLPILCDPSHITGKKDLIKDVSQKALDLNFNGLMIESHCNPKEALSDVAQQLTPKEFNLLIDKLVFRKTISDNNNFLCKLESLREQIDSIDQQMLELFAQRMKIVDKIGEYKCENEVTILQLRRWEKIIETRRNAGKNLGLSEDFIKKIFQLIHKEAI